MFIQYWANDRSTIWICSYCYNKWNYYYCDSCISVSASLYALVFFVRKRRVKTTHTTEDITVVRYTSRRSQNVAIPSKITDAPPLSAQKTTSVNIATKNRAATADTRVKESNSPQKIQEEIYEAVDELNTYEGLYT